MPTHEAYVYSLLCSLFHIQCYKLTANIKKIIKQILLKTLERKLFKTIIGICVKYFRCFSTPAFEDIS
jgi:fatty-acid desaturase